ncbi:S1-like domain-containing RNA-binding protein [Alteromonas sp. W364]|uniref:CvfB family protein n=1 Tax=Alteromonas sp. W364 TaxID=3075610 RepID=UPI0028856296|nr:S1-like domain-containing RNA-binding protein [Alteromonas sp. W364]MDT0627212.1 S1-like domain-containing RNA-binding protein [Alteromonas sp. W364]
MLEIGNINSLLVIDILPFGYTLAISEDTPSEQKVFLPIDDAKGKKELEQSVDAYVYYSQDGSLHASEKPIAIKVNDFAVLTCTGVTDFGAFFDWGLERDLLVPRSLQHKPLDEGLSSVVYLIHDEDNHKMIGCTKLHRFLEETTDELSPGEEVDLLIFDETSLGFKAVINKRFQGLLFKSDLFRTVKIGERCKAYVKEVREDGKINLSLQKLGSNARKDLAQQILDDLDAHGGLSTLTDKSPSEEIQAHYHVSKGAYKRAIGNLYKQKKITISKTHIKLNK